MAEQKFNIGDVVELKSGGPQMTVRGYEPADSQEITCEWFDKDRKLCSKSFHQDTLQKYIAPDLSVSFGNTPNPNRY